jgi:hypothetical protein
MLTPTRETGAVDLTFWAIQAVLLTPVLFMAASAGAEAQPGRDRRHLPPEPPEPTKAASPVALAVAGLSQFTAEQQARLVILRSFVQEARRGRGPLSDDVAAAPSETPQPVSRPRGQQLWLAAGALLVLVGAVGVVRTSLTIDDLQRQIVARVEPLSPAAKFLPGVIVHPGKYLAAINGGSGAGTSASGDLLDAVSVMEQKQAMDRWEALAGVGLSLLLFASALRGGAADDEDEHSSVASDVAPFVLVAAVLFAGLSFFELP